MPFAAILHGAFAVLKIESESMKNMSKVFARTCMAQFVLYVVLGIVSVILLMAIPRIHAFADEAPTTETPSSAQEASVAKSGYSITEGTYTLSPKSTSKRLQVRSAKTPSGSKIVLKKKNNSTMLQKWFIRPVEGSPATYRIQSVQSGRYISNNEGKVVEAGYSNNPRQMWIATKEGGSYVFASKVDESVLTAFGKAGVSVADASDSKAQRFAVSKTPLLPAGAYYIQPKSSNNVVSVSGHLTKVGSNVKLLKKASDSSRKWIAVINKDGTYTFRNANSARVLAAASGKKGANVSQGTLSNARSKKWKLVLNKKGGINIVSALNAKLVLGSSSVKYGANNKLIKATGSKGAIFTFKKTSDSALRTKMARKIKKFSSKTGWLLVANTKSCFVGVYKGKKGNWTPYAYFPCSPGAPGSPSLKGVYKIGSKGYAFGSSTYTCYYFSQYCGNYLFHSVLYNRGTFQVQDGRMGQHLSHGCVRLEIANAKWIYNNIPKGTTVYVY